MNRKKYILLIVASFFLPALITIAALAALKVTPFGNNMLLFGDSYSYYTPWLSYLTSVLRGEHSMYYSFSDGIGGNIALIDNTQLFHPISIFYLLAGWDYMPQAFTVAVVFDTSLCGLTMFLCLSGILGKKEENIIFSTSYALMGYMVAYNYNPLFHMGVVFLPLMVLGLFILIEEKKPALYIISIAYTVLSGIQMGFILCMASLFFFAAYLFVKNSTLTGRRKEVIIRYITASVTGGFLGSVVWMPALFSCTDRIKGTDVSDFLFVDNGPILQMAAKLFSGADSTKQLIDGYPVIFCGIFTVFLAILYFMNKEISKREKAAAAAILVIYVLSFYIRTFKSAFQGFSGNTWFNHRQSFVFSFVLIFIAAKEMRFIDSLDMKMIKKALIILVIAVLMIFSTNYEFITGGNAVADMLILALILACYVFYRFNPDRSDKKSLILIMLLCVSLQLYINYYSSEKNILDDWGLEASEFSNDIFLRQPLVYAIMTNDNSFYRMEIENQMTEGVGQDPFLFRYNGVGHATYSSYSVTDALQKLGINRRMQKINYYDSGVTAATDSLLGLKYIISNRDLEKEKNYKRLMTAAGEYCIFENPYALGLLVVSNEDIKDVSLDQEKNIFEVQNKIWKAMTGEDKDIFIKEDKYDIEVHNATESVFLKSEDVNGFMDEMQEYINDEEDKEEVDKEKEPEVDEWGNRKYPGLSYIEVNFPAARDGAVYIYDSAAVIEDYGTDEDALMYLGNYRKGETVSGRLYFNDPVNRPFLALTIDGLQIYYSDSEVLEEYSKKIRNRASSITRISDTLLTGTLNTGDSQLMLFTIPYDKAWKLSVDGIETDTFISADLFLSAMVPSGEHSFELQFKVPGLSAGIVLSILASILFVVQVMAFTPVLNRKIRKMNTIL